MKLCFLQLCPLSIGFFFKPCSVEQCRYMIDKLDDQIYKKLEERMKFSELIAIQKKNTHLSVNQTEREEIIFRRLKNKSILSNQFVERVWTEILEESKRLQKKTLEK